MNPARDCREETNQRKKGGKKLFRKENKLPKRFPCIRSLLRSLKVIDQGQYEP